MEDGALDAYHFSARFTAGSEAAGTAGKRATNIQSLLGTARLNGLDPMKCLAETLEKLPVWPDVNSVLYIYIRR
jgi:hypothetical protein